MALPLLPGHLKTLGKEKFHKSHHFDYFNGLQVEDTEKPGIGGELLQGQKPRPKYSVFPKGKSSGAPSWLACDKLVLCFEAFLQEPVTQSREETYRIRKCKINFYLEDDTIEVVEPQFKNSGMKQGILIHRHRIPLPTPDDDKFYNVHHFNINQKMEFYSRTFMITGCNLSTYNFLSQMGVRVNKPAMTPADPYTSLRKEMEATLNPLLPYEKQDTLRQFLDNDRKVLRFHCYWNDPDNTVGDPIKLILHYYLVDDTIEILQVVQPNSGRDALSKFLSRNKLPKLAPTPQRRPGEITDRTVLNVFGKMNRGARYLIDNRKTGAVHEEFYKDSDLVIGQVINVWGRRVVICDCDNFTKAYYHSKYGIEDFTPVRYRGPPPAKVDPQMPPYTGFGSEEDSLCSCQGLMPKPPQKDFRKLMEKDRQGLDSHVLRFGAKMLTDNPIDMERNFIVCYYLSDDTITVFEPTKQNSGLIGGKFLERTRVKKPGQELFKSEMSEYYKPQDLYVGAQICINNWYFQLVDADDYAFSYMEQHAGEFPRANLRTIICKLKSISEEKHKKIKEFLAQSDPNNTGFIPYEAFRSLLANMISHLSEHEIITLGRVYSVRKQAEPNVGLMLAIAQSHLRKKQFESFSDMLRALTHEDRNRCGRLSFKEVRTICKAFHLPLDDDLLRGLLHRFVNEAGELDYHAFLSGINWRENPSPPLPQDMTFKFDLYGKGEALGTEVKNVFYSVLLEDVFRTVGCSNIY